MNLIDVTNTHHHYHSNNKVVVVTKRDGIQGPEGKNGISPHIDPKTLHWFVGDEDTGVFAGMSNTDDITLIHLFDTKSEFPSAGTSKDLYLDKKTSTIYCWDAFLSNYRIFKADYVTNLEEVVMNLQSSMIRIDNSSLKKPQNLIEGSLILTDANGIVSCTDVTYEDLLEKIESKADVGLPTDFIPDSVIVGSEDGTIVSSDITKSELTSAITLAKNALTFVGEKKSDNLVLVDETGAVKSSEVSQEELIEAIESTKTAVKYKGEIIPGSLILSTEDGQIESSEVTQEELIAAIESTKTAVRFEEETVPGFVVVSGENGGIKNSVVSNTELISAINNSVKYEGEVVPDTVVFSNESGGIKSSDISYSSITKAIEDANNAVKPKNPIIAGSLIVGTEDGQIESSTITHEELIDAIESTKTAVRFVGEVIDNSLVLADSDGNIKSSGKTFDELVEELKNSGVQSDWNEINTNSPAFIKNKPDVVTRTEYEELSNIVSRKAEFISTITPGTLITSDSSGNLYSTNLNMNSVVTADSIISGSITESVIIDEEFVSSIVIPDSVKIYKTIDVYHNGKLLVKDIHYTFDEELTTIILTGFTANVDDIFSFVGHGVTSTKEPSGGGCDHTHLNMSVLDSITQERVDSWDTITTHNHDDLYVRKDELIEANLPVATESVLGGVKSSTDVNKITVAEDGTMSVNKIDVSLLTSINDKPEGGEDYDLILSSGSSYSYRK